MKKQLLAGAFVLASFLTAQAQTETHNFNDQTVGVLNSDITGNTEGEDGWFAIGSNGGTGTTTTNMTSEALQVIAGDEAHGNVLEIAGPNGSLGYISGAQLPGQFYFDAASAGNVKLNTTFDYYTGTANADSENFFTVTSYGIDEDDNFYALGGFAFDAKTQEVYGQAYLDASGTQEAGNYYIFLGETSGTTVTLPDNTWVTFSYGYDVTNGDLEFQASANGEVLFSGTFQGASELADNLIPVQVEFGASNGAAGNTASATRQFDNVNFIANTNGVLATKPVIAPAQFSVFPNPANDVVNVTVDASINNVSIADLNGRTVKTVKFAGVSETQVNVSDLASGIYMMTISSDKGATTKKIIKN